MSGVIVWVGVAVFGAAGAYARFSFGAWVGARRPAPSRREPSSSTSRARSRSACSPGCRSPATRCSCFGTGLLGAYTTFSTWMVEAQRLAEEAEFAAMTAYLVLSMVAGLAAAGLGWAIGGALS